MSRVFIIEPEESIRHSLSIYLAAQGYEIAAAPAPLDCEVFRGHRCDKQAPCGDALLVANLTPGMTGIDFVELQAARGCRGSSRHKAVMSGAFTPEEMRRARSLGCRVFQKPVAMQDIADWLRRRSER